MVDYWIKKKGDGNVALRMPPALLGIDVDNYDGKDGAATLAACETEWGPLPATWRTTSRTDGVSGIRLFRIPAGLAWPGKLPGGGGVELCRWDHRYVIVAPSIHDKTGEQYHWFAPDGSRTTGAVAASEGGDWEFPALDELAELPTSWVEGLTSGKKWEERPEEDLGADEVNQWILDRPDGELCDKMQRTLDGWMTKISAAGEDGGAHDSARDAAWAVLRDAAAGHCGVQVALRKIMLAHKEALRARRPEKAAGEWASIKARGVRKVAAEGPTDDDDPCATSAVSRAPRVRNRGSEGMDFERDDIGNGQRFALQWRDEVRWVPEFDKWYVWRDKVWAPDVDGEVMRMATKTVRGMKAEAAYIEDTKEKGAFLKFVRSSSNEGKLKAMLNQAKANKGISASAASFDTNMKQLVCANGTLELPIEFDGGQVRRIRSLQEHYNTVQTGTDYVASAELPEWDKFLARFQPDVEVRDWLQKLAGYSLLGSNPRRLMVVALGDSSTGKTTFAEAVSGALGAYAGSANMTIFRDNQDDKPRPDLLRVLPKRFVYAEEASRSWHLHPDQIKRLTGGAPVTARAMRANEYVDRIPSFTPWLFSNHAPTIDGGDTALWRRMLVVPFDVVIPKSEEDAGFRLRLASPVGRQAILAWLVRGYQAYLRAPDSLQEIPAGAMVANAKFRAEVSDLSMCLEDICEFGPDLFCAPDELYQAYRTWCEINNTAPRDVMSGTKFGREVNGEYAKKMMKVDGKPVRMRVGLQIKRSWLKTMT
jgi:putative DNA primase/helicase